MKIINLVVAVFCGFCFSACGAFYGSEAQYASGDYYGLASSDEAVKILQDKLALEKLKNGPVQGDAGNGYLGVVFNETNRSITVKLKGPETKSYFLAKGEQAEDYLIPGQYTAEFLSGNKVSYWNFKVSNKVNHYKGQKLHWFTGYVN